MKNLKRNKKVYWYALYSDKKRVVDEDGNETGEITRGYETPVKDKASISANTGTTGIEQFGNFADYDKVIITDDMSNPMDENTVVWIGETPDESGENYNYVVKRRAECINNISFAIQKKERTTDNG